MPPSISFQGVYPILATPFHEDEGLDLESLDMAMKALIDLQERGRTVGVISHVEEMKQQIDVAIEVVPGLRGSRVRLRGAQ